MTDLGFFYKDEAFHGYTVEKLLGRGGAGAVYLVRHTLLNMPYALKVLNPSVATSDVVSVKRFLREARIATHIRHPNLVAVHDCGFDEAKELYYFVMDYVSGGSLRQALAFEGSFAVERAADVIAQVSRALNASRTYGVVHRDIKPENIMIQPDGLVKLVDLGIAKAQNLGDSVQTNTSTVFGTPAYVSPEQALCSAHVDSRADIYSLGVVFFEMLAGRCPYLGATAATILSQILSEDPEPDIRSLKPEIPTVVADLVRRMMAKKVEKRIGSFDEVLSKLDEIGCRRREVAGASGEIVSEPEVGMKTLLESFSDATESLTEKKTSPLNTMRSWGTRFMDWAMGRG